MLTRDEMKELSEKADRMTSELMGLEYEASVLRSDIWELETQLMDAYYTNATTEDFSVVQNEGGNHANN
jgi:hypothetical protein